MSITGPDDGPPYKVGVAVTDIITGIYASTAILAAVQERHRTGRGQHIDMALLDCAVSVMANQAMNYLATGSAPGRLGNFHPNLAPYQVVPCADGHIIIATGNDGQFQRLCALLARPDLGESPDYATNADRVARRADLSDSLCAETMGWTKAALLAACEAHGVPAGPINDMAEVFLPIRRSKPVGYDWTWTGLPGCARHFSLPIPPPRAPPPCWGRTTRATSPRRTCRPRARRGRP